MDMIRRTLGGLFAILGGYYCVLSVRTLANLHTITARWIERSGDPEFKYDYYNFAGLITVGALLVGVLGYRTAVKGTRAALGRRESWLALAIGAPLLHWCWFLYRTVGNATLPGHAQLIANRTTLARFGLICLAYVVMWLVMRRRNSATGLAATGRNPSLVCPGPQIADAGSHDHRSDRARLATSRVCRAIGIVATATSLCACQIESRFDRPLATVLRNDLDERIGAPR
jgi:hypothetical protein